MGDLRPGPGAMDVEAIMARIPHRYPFLLVDRILEIELGRRIVGLKNVSVNEPFFQGHFPGHPIMPGVLVAEAMAQVGGVLASFFPSSEGLTAYFAAIERCRFRRPVRPGDQLITEVIVLRARSRIGQMQATARVDGVVVADGVFTYSMAPLDLGPGGTKPASSGAAVPSREAGGRPAGHVPDPALREEAPRAGR